MRRAGAQPETAELIALVDLGSNASRFLLARVVEGRGFEVLQKERVQTRLGDGPPGRLRPAAVDATLDCVHRFLRRVRNGRSPRVVAIATAAVRDATNRDLLLDALREREGVAVRVLTGPEEARLGAEAAMLSLPIRDGIVADLGGASLQLTQVRDRHLGRSVSLPLGTIRLTQRFLRGDPPSPAEVERLRREVGELLTQALPTGRPGDRLIGLGGTVRSLGRIHLAARPDDRSRGPHRDSEPARAGSRPPAAPRARSQGGARRHHPGRGPGPRRAHAAPGPPRRPHGVHGGGPRWAPLERGVRGPGLGSCSGRARLTRE